MADSSSPVCIVRQWPRPNWAAALDEASRQNRLPLPTANTKPFLQTEWPNPRVNSRWREADEFPSLLQTTLVPNNYIFRQALTSSQARRHPRPEPPFDFPNTLRYLTAA